jgi:hypothetical protein
MKLRKHRREATKLAAKATANRKATAHGTQGELAASPASTGTATETRPAFRFRVEFWKVDPEIRMGHAEITLYKGDQIKNLAWAFADRMLDFCHGHMPKAPSPFDVPVEKFVASDEDIPF